jgi:polyferredoxin
MIVGRSRLVRLARDLGQWGPARRALGLPIFQFLTVLPAAAMVGVVLASSAFGLEHPGLNFGLVATWLLWWGALLLSIGVFGRAWCLVCPLGAAAEWLQRLSLWWRSPYTAGLDLPWPRRLRTMWPATGLYVLFVFLDSGYGMSNSPRMTAALVVLIALAAAWVSLIFERRAFCRWVCPLTSFIGLGALASMFELRRRDPGTCSACSTKDCFRGNERRWGCPMGEYPGGGMDSNLYCILCTECLKSCPRSNIVVRFRTPGRDLWAMRRPRIDGAWSAAVIVGVVTVVPLLVVVFLPALRHLLSRVVPAGSPPNDPPRLLAAALLFAAGIAVTTGLVYGGSALGRLAALPSGTTARTVFTRYAYALVPIGLSKLMADLLDHALATWGALPDVTRALLLDFPLNRVMPERMTAVSPLGPIAVYAAQVALLLVGLVWTLCAMRRVSDNLFIDREAALASFVPMAGVALILSLVSVWTLGIGLL